MNRNSVWTSIRVASAAAVFATFTGCGSGGSDNPPPPPVVVTVNAPAATLQLGDPPLTYTATVTGTSDTAVDWSVSGAGCSGTTCGTITSAGVYTAPDIVPAPPTVSITATSRADTTQSASAALTIGSDVELSVWPQAARVTINNRRQFLRMLTGSSNAAVRWSIDGTGCTTTACGSVDASGQYLAPSLMPANATVFVTATSVVDPGKSARAEVTLQSANNAAISGAYVHLNRGHSLGFWGVSGGAFMADGAGSLSGVLDRGVSASWGGSLVNLAHTGRYALGNDYAGDLTLELPGGDNAWRMTVNAAGNRFYMQPVFGTDTRATAEVYKQDPAAFTNSAVNGTYVFRLDGNDVAGTRIANIGRFTANGAGVISNGVLESNEGGAAGTTTFTGSYNVAANGRAPMQITTPSRTFGFAMYVISADMLMIISNDEVVAGVPARIGLALRQSGGPFGVASLSGSHVFELAGRNAATAAIATVGRLVSDGAGAITGQFDRNDNYVNAVGANLAATYTVDADGRGTISSTTLPNMVFYLAGPGKALLMETPNARAQTGTLERQLAAPYSTANLIGEFAQGMFPPALLSSLSVTARVVYDGAGSETSRQDVNAALPCGLSIGGTTTAPYSVSSTGRISILDGGGTPLAAGYLMTPGRYVLVLQRASGGACDEVVHHYVAEQ